VVQRGAARAKIKPAPPKLVQCVALVGFLRVFFEVRCQRAAKVVYEQNVYALMTLICVQQQQ